MFKKMFQSILINGIKIAIITFVTYYTSNRILKLTTLGKIENAKKLLKSLGINKNIELDDYEADIVFQIVNPDKFELRFQDIGGMEEIISSIKSDVISLIKNPSFMKSSTYYRPPKGILLYGPPGCGKTLIAQATAKECNARFINLNVSTLTSKWYGESSKLTNALFTLAEKISPCIIFIDEIDTFLRSRSMNDNEATLMMKAIFLQKLDGFRENRKSQIIIMAATNCRNNIDEAILSRMELQFRVELPNLDQRKKIFGKLIKKLHLDSNVNIKELAELTNKFSGRDIDNLCREVCMDCLREHLDICERNETLSNDEDFDNSRVRKINRNDFLKGINKKRKTLYNLMD